MRAKFAACHRIVSFSMAIVLALSFSFTLTTAAADTPLRDKDTNTAYIAEKSAEWVDFDNYLAELTLAVNGTQTLKPLDVIICLDRSGSMDMNFILPTSGDHNSSCPCLNQDHFYLEPKIGASANVPPGIGTSSLIYDSDAKTLTVYNPANVKGATPGWVVLDTSNKVHLYYEFGSATATNSIKSDYYLAPYHFTIDESKGDDAYVRISKWDETDVRKTPNNKTPGSEYPGIWDHADEDMECFDRWMEAKQAVKDFSKAVLDAHEKNNVALAPFSIRDSTMLTYVNGLSYYREWLLDQNSTRHFFDGNVDIGNDNKLSGTYDSKVDWTGKWSDIDTMLPRLFTTGDTDYIYALSMAYNMLTERSDEAKKTKHAVVVFLSDGTPYPSTGADTWSFYNPDLLISWMTDAIKEDTDKTYIGEEGNTPLSSGSMLFKPEMFWPSSAPGSSLKRRHDINSNYLAQENGTIVGAPGLGAQIVTVGYMLDSQANKDRLTNMASHEECYIDIPADSTATTQGDLSKMLLNSSVFPGGRDSVLRDVVSKYFYVPDDAVLPPGVTIDGSIASGQTIVWTIGDIYRYEKSQQPTIKIPLVLREEYRTVSKTTYYPTNADNPEPPLTTPDRGPDGPDTGAKLDYTDPDDRPRYDTIGTPKLPVPGKGQPNPDPDDPGPSPKPDDPTPPSKPDKPDKPDNPNDTPDFVPGETPVPLSEVPQLSMIFDDGVPLANLPRTGSLLDSDYTKILAASAIMLFASILLIRRREW